MEMSEKLILPIFVVDAFTKTAFSGNPAGVCVLTDEKGKKIEISEKMKQKIASEMNLSETAFVQKLETGINEFKLQWFTPTVEVDLCGHGTLGTCHILLQETKLVSAESPSVTFHTLSGPLTVERKEGGSLQMNFPAGNPVEVTLSANSLDGIRTHLSFPPEAKIESIWHCAKTKKLVVELANLNHILALKINPEPLLNVPFGNLNVRGIIVTAKGNPQHPVLGEYDFISRYFTPWNGINEDPVTGSAHCVLTVYWSEKLKKKRMRAYQASSRGGILGVELLNDRVLLEGNSATVLRGTLQI
jgi:PhzF family phenazine biosynthesis protein